MSRLIAFGLVAGLVVVIYCSPGLLLLWAWHGMTGLGPYASSDSGFKWAAGISTTIYMPFALVALTTRNRPASKSR